MFGRKLIKLSHVISVRFVQPAAKKGNPRKGERKREKQRMKSGKEYENEVEVEAPNCKRNPNSKLKTKIETNWPAPAMDMHIDVGKGKCQRGKVWSEGTLRKLCNVAAAELLSEWLIFSSCQTAWRAAWRDPQPATSNEQRANGQRRRVAGCSGKL